MAIRLVIDGNSVYEIDESCVREKNGSTGRRRGEHQVLMNRKSVPQGPEKQIEKRENIQE